MKQSSKRLVSAILALTFIFVAFLIFLNFIRPVYNETQALRVEILNKQREIESKKVIINQFESLIQEYQSQTQLQENLSLILPQHPNVAEALIQISGLLDSNDISLLSFNISNPVNNAFDYVGDDENNFKFLKPVGWFEINLKGAGAYSNIQKFLSQLESNIRLFSIKNINISRIKTQDKNEFNNLFFDITVVSYYQVEN